MLCLTVNKSHCFPKCMASRLDMTSVFVFVLFLDEQGRQLCPFCFWIRGQDGVGPVTLGSKKLQLYIETSVAYTQVLQLLKFLQLKVANGVGKSLHTRDWV